MSKIIALVDGSEYSESVCHHTAWIAGRLKADVDLYHVLGRRDGGNGDLSGNLRLGARSKILGELAELDAQRAKLAQAQGRAILDDAKAIVEADGVRSVTPHLRIGDLVETVSSQEADADLVVIGKRGEAADFAKLHLGSNTERVARVSTKPVFVTSRAFTPIETVLIAFDGGVNAMRAVDYVARNSLFSGMRCTVVFVGKADDAMQTALADAQATLSAGGHEAEIKVIDGAADVALGELIETEGFDLLVMGTYGHSRIRRLIIGSTATQMMRSCKVPVLLMR